jgi:hypothetical protein
MPREVINYDDNVDTEFRQFGNHQGRVAHEGVRPTGAQGLSSESHRTLQVGSGVSKVRSLLSRAKKNIKNMTRPKLKIHAGNFDQV